MIPIWISTISLFTFILVGAALIGTELQDYFHSFVIFYSFTFLILSLAHEQGSDYWLSDYLTTELSFEVDEDKVSPGAMRIDLSEEDIQEYYRLGMNDGYPTEFIIFLMFSLAVLSLISLNPAVHIPNQLYGVFHSAVGGMILVQDRIRITGNMVFLGIRGDGKNWIEAACGFTFISFGFILQVFALLL